MAKHRVKIRITNLATKEHFYLGIGRKEVKQYASELKEAGYKVKMMCPTEKHLLSGI